MFAGVRRCGSDRNLVYIFCPCPCITKLWSLVETILQKSTKYAYPNDPSFFTKLLSLTAQMVNLYSATSYMLPSHASYYYGGKTEAHSMWTTRVEEIGQMEDLVLTYQNKDNIYLTTWFSWTEFMALTKAIRQALVPSQHVVITSSLQSHYGNPLLASYIRPSWPYNYQILFPDPSTSPHWAWLLNSHRAWLRTS